MPPIAKKFVGRGVPILELIDEGLPVVARALEGFNVNLGYKFSTYAWRSIESQLERYVQGRQKNDSRWKSLDQMAADSAMRPDDFIRRPQGRHIARFETEEVVWLLNHNQTGLDTRDKTILSFRFGMNIEEINPHEITETLDQVGVRLDLSKERVRQIQDKALTKLRKQLLLGEAD